jgi:inosine-uridine nucleoside N-ribohydrolase
MITKEWSLGLTVYLFLGVSAICVATYTAATGPVPIILDTDMMTDCDDAAALGVLHALEDNGEAKILGVALSAHDRTHYNGATISAINYYYNKKHNIPIGVWHELATSKGNITDSMEKHFRYDHQGMHEAVRDNFINDGKLNYQRERSLEMYKRVLSEAADHSVKIVVVGTNFNIERLLREESALVNRKVKEIVIGSSPDGNVNMCSRGASRLEAKRASDYIFTHAPGNIKMTAWIAGFSNYIANKMSLVGQGYKGTETPMETTYQYAYSGLSKGRPVWDQLAVIYAVRGASFNGKAYFDVHDYGYLHPHFESAGKGTWKTDYNKPSHRQVGYNSNTPQLTKIIGDLMMQKPKGEDNE